jgi:hypothetical protein
MVKRVAVASKEVMEGDSMLAMITEDQYLFHLGLLRTGPLHYQSHTTTAPPDDARSSIWTIEYYYLKVQYF